MATSARELRNLPISRQDRLSRSGRIGLGLLALQVVLQFIPPIPPFWKGSIWHYVIGYTAILLLVKEVAHLKVEILEAWQRVATARRWRIGGLLVTGTLGGTLMLRAAAPEVFGRFSREEGLWEPLTLLCYLGALLLLWAVRDAAANQKAWRLLAGFYLLLVLEEIDYFGIFGGIIGRIDGVYAGSLHDIIRLIGKGVLPPTAIVAIFIVAVAAIVLLWRTGYLDLGWLGSRAAEREFLWVVLALGFLFTAAISDAGLFGWLTTQPTPEEAIEMVGAMCMALYGLELASQRLRSSSGDPRAYIPISR